MDSTSSAMLHCIALCMLPFACKSWAVKTAFPFSEYTQLYSFKASTGEEVHSVSEPLPAYMLPQDPYFSVIKKYLQPPLDACSGPDLKDEQLRHIWNALPDAADGIFDGFAEAFRLAHQATIWGVPSVQIASAFTKSALNKTSPFPTLSINAVVNYPDPLDGTRPPQAGAQDVNFLYSLAWIDLTGGPLVITAPDTSGRFYELQFVDVYNETPLLIGPLTSPLGAGLTGPLRYVLAFFGYNDTIPDGYNHTAIMSSNTLWMIGRLAIKAGNIPDLATAQAMQAGFKIEPLFPKTYKKPFAMPARDLYRRGVVAMVTPYRLWGADKGPYVTTEDFYPENSPPPIYKNASAFWELLGAITAINPPTDPPQAALYSSFAPMGLSLRGFGFDPNNLTTGTLGGMNVGLAAALGCVAYTAQTKQQALVTSTRWEPLLGSTSYGTDYLERSQAAITSLGTNPKSVSMTYLSQLATDRDQWGPGRPLDGSLYNYTLSFAQAPSVTTSWSLTPYARNGSLITDVPYDADSGLHRYSITDTTPGFNTKSGSLMVFMSATPPQYGTLQYSNWLPICRGPFYLVLRLYGPSKLAQEGNYSPPPVYAFEGVPAFTSTIAEVASLTNVLWVPQPPAPSP